MSEEIEKIPSDSVVVMTEIMHRAFNAGGCDPMCHCCCKDLLVGEKFKLATVSTFNTEGISETGISKYSHDVTKEVMLCDKCTVEKMNRMSKKKQKALEEYRERGGGCFRINGKIVH